jgi:hypothetical protein
MAGSIHGVDGGVHAWFGLAGQVSAEEHEHGSGDCPGVDGFAAEHRAEQDRDRGEQVDGHRGAGRPDPASQGGEACEGGGGPQAAQRRNCGHTWPGEP